jgi:hypothetical protein
MIGRRTHLERSHRCELRTKLIHVLLGNRDGLCPGRRMIDLYADQEQAACARDTFDLGDRLVEIVNMVERVQTRDDVEVTIWKGNALRGSLDVLHVVAARPKPQILADERIEANALGGHRRPFQAAPWAAADVDDLLVPIVVTCQTVDRG